MKLWHVVQWGNPVDGGNGDDAQCIISASSLELAVETAEQHFQAWNKALGNALYMNGKCHVVHLMGQDDKPDGEPVMVIHHWLAPAVNPSKMSYWVRHEETDSWEKIDE